MTSRLFFLSTSFLLLSSVALGQTMLIKGKAQKLITNLKKNGSYPMGGRDTLLDLNGDRFQDVLIEFYGQSGTGEKNGIEAYLYDTLKKTFKHCEQLDYLANPTFYRSKKIVVGYYLGNGGGGATKLKWKGLLLDTIEHITIDVTSKESNITFKLKSHNYITGKKTVKTLPIMSLPDEYNYADYKPIITTSSR